MERHYLLSVCQTVKPHSQFAVSAKLVLVLVMMMTVMVTCGKEITAICPLTILVA